MILRNVSEENPHKMASRMQEYRERSRKRKEMLKVAILYIETKNNSILSWPSKVTLGVDNLSEALGCQQRLQGRKEDIALQDREECEGEVEEEERRSEEETQFRDSTAFLKGTQSLNPHNDYSQNFVDTGQRPQNFIRDTGLTGRYFAPALIIW